MTYAAIRARRTALSIAVVALLVALGLVVVPAKPAIASVTPGSVSPNVGSIAGGLTTTITLATNGGMASSSNGVVFLGVDGNIYRAKDGLKLDAGGMTFTSASGFVDQSGVWHITGIGTDQNAYSTSASAPTTLSKVGSLPTTAVASYSGMAILGADQKLYFADTGDRIGGDFTSASATLSAQGTRLINAVGTNGFGYWNGGGTTITNQISTVRAQSVGSALTMIGVDGNVYRSSDGQVLSVTGGSNTFSSSSGYITSSDKWVMAALSVDGYAYVTAQNGTALTKVALSTGGAAIKILNDGLVAQDASGSIYRLTDGQKMTGPTGVSFSSPSAYLDSSGNVNIAAVGSDGKAYVASNSTTFTALNTSGSPKTFTSATIGGATVPATQTGQFTVTATTPSHAAGVVDIVLTASDSSTVTFTAAFTYMGFAITSPTAGQTVPWSPTVTGVGVPGANVAVSAVGVGAVCSAVVDTGGGWSCVSTLSLPRQGSFTLTATQTGVGNPSTSTVAVSTVIPATISPAAGPKSGGTAVTVTLGTDGAQRSTFDGEGYVGMDGVLRLNDSSRRILSAPVGVSFTSASSFANNNRWVAAIGSDGKAYYNAGTSTMTAVSLPTGVTGVTTAAGTYILGSDGNVYSATNGNVANGLSSVVQLSATRWAGGNYFAAVTSDGSLYYTGSGSLVKTSLPSGVTAATLSGIAVLGSDNLVYGANGVKVVGPNGITFTAASGMIQQVVAGSWLISAIGSDNNAYYSPGTDHLAKVTLPTGVTPTAVYGGAVIVGSDGRAYRASDGALVGGIPNGVTLSSISGSIGDNGSYISAMGSDGVAYFAGPGTNTFSPVSLSKAPKSYTSMSVGGAAATGVSQNELTVSASTPAHSIGAVNVVLTAADGSTLTVSNTFTFFDFAITSPTAGQTIPWIPTVAGTGYPGTSVAVTALGIGAVCTAVVDVSGAWSCSSTVTFPQQGSFTLTAVQIGGGSPSTAPVSVVTSIPAPTLSPAVGPRSGGTAITAQLGANGGQRSTYDGGVFVGLDGTLRLDDTAHTTFSPPAAGVSFTSASSFAASARYVAAVGSDGKAYYSNGTSTLSAVPLPTGVTGVTTASGVFVLASDGNIYLANSAGTLISTPGGVPFAQISGFKWSGNNYVAAIGSDGNLYYNNGASSLTKQSLPSKVTALSLSGTAVVGSDRLVYQANGGVITGPNGVTFSAASGDLDQSDGTWITTAIGNDNNAYYTRGTGAFSKVTLAGGVTPVATYGGAVFVGSDGRAYRASDGSLVTGVPNGVSLSSISASLGLNGAYVTGIGSDGVAYFAGPGTSAFVAVALSNAPKTYTGVSTGGTAATSVVQSGVTSSVSVTAVTPAHAAGVVSVVLSASDGSSLTLSSAFTFVDFAISSPTSNQVVSRYPTVAGTGMPGASVSVSLASLGTLCTATVDSGGAWSCTSTVQLPSYGTFTLNATQTGIGNPANASVTVRVGFAQSFAITSPTAGQTIPWVPTVSGTGYPDATVAVTALGLGAVCSAVVDLSGAWSCSSTVTFPQQGSFTLTAVQTGGTGPSTAAVSVVTSIPAPTLSPAVGPRSGGTAVTVQLGANGGQRSTYDGLLFVGLDGGVRQSTAATLTAPAGVSFATASSTAYGGHYDVSALGSDGKAYWASTTAAFAAASLATGVTPVATSAAVVLLGSDGKLYWADGSGLLGGQAGVTFSQVSAYRAQSTGYAYISAIGSDNSLYYNNGTTTMSKWSSLPTSVTPVALTGAAVLGSDGRVYRNPDAALISGPNGVTFSSVSGYTDYNGYRQIAAIGSDGNAYFNFGTTTFSKVTLPGGVIPTTTSGGLVVGSKSGQVYLTVDGSLVGGPAGVTYTSVSSGFGQNGRYITAIGSDGIGYAATPGTSTFVAVALSNTPKTYTAVSTGGAAATNVSQSGLTSSVTVSATTPAHSAGVVNVVLTASDGSTLTLPNSFTFADFAISSPTSNQYVTRYPTISGIGMPGTSVAVSVTSVGTLCTTTVDSGGAWSCTSTLQLPQHGTFTLNAVQTGIGNPASASVSVVVSVDWTVSTSATVAGAAVANGALVASGDLITYQVNYVSSAGIAMAAVTSTDDLTDVLDDATFVANSGRLVVDGAAAVAVPDPSANVLTVPAFSLPAGKSAVLIYQVTVNLNRWGAVLSRTVTATSTTEPPLSCGAACSTTEQTAVPLQVQKVGEDSSANVVPMTGSQWAVYSSANATTPVVGPVPASSGVGLFRSTALPAGTYWLEESTALSGFSLLAQRVQFTLNPDLSITLVSSPSNVTVTTVNGSATIRVMDVPRMALPQAGGPGTSFFYLAGFGLISLAAIALIVASLVRRFRSSGRIRKVIS